MFGHVDANKPELSLFLSLLELASCGTLLLSSLLLLQPAREKETCASTTTKDIPQVGRRRRKKKRPLTKTGSKRGPKMADAYIQHRRKG